MPMFVGVPSGPRAPAVGTAGVVASPQAGVPSAQIIDLSARIGDQLYDQYADAEVRAVGD